MLIGSAGAYPQTDENAQYELAADAVIYSTLQGGVPLSFSYGHIVYENLGQAGVATPTLYECRVVQPTKNRYEGDMVLREKIRVGIYYFFVKELSAGCFKQTDVTSANIYSNIRTIPQQAFMYCPKLEWVRFHGNSPHFIEDAAFLGCTNLSKIEFPAQLKHIGERAFSQCKSLKSIYLPKDLETLGEEAFQSCESLAELTFATGHFRKIPRRCFYDCASLKSVTIPEGVSEIGSQAFYYCGLTEVDLPRTIQTIDNNAFGQTPLKKITVKAVTPPSLGQGFTDRDFSQITIYVPASALKAYRSHPEWNKFKNIKTL